MDEKKYYRPLPDFLTIKSNRTLSKKTGRRELGLYTTKVILEDEILGITHIKDDRAEGGLFRTPLGGFFNHSEKPNCILVEDGDFFHLKTIKDIYPNDELTVKYIHYDPTK